MIMDHVVDAVDRNGATELVFRSGATVDPTGQLDVNCTATPSAATTTTTTTRALRFPQWRSAIDTAAVRDTALDLVHGLLHDALTVLGQDQ